MSPNACRCLCPAKFLQGLSYCRGSFICDGASDAMFRRKFCGLLGSRGMGLDCICQDGGSAFCLHTLAVMVLSSQNALLDCEKHFWTYEWHHPASSGAFWIHEVTEHIQWGFCISRWLHSKQTHPHFSTKPGLNPSPSAA